MYKVEVIHTIVRDGLGEEGVEANSYRSQSLLGYLYQSFNFFQVSHGKQRFFQAEGLVEELKKMDLTQSHVFWPHSANARPVISNFLSENRIRCTDCVLYEPHPHTPDEKICKTTNNH